MAAKIPAETWNNTLAYFYMLSFCPPDQLKNFKQVSSTLRKSIADQAGMPQIRFFPEAVPLICWRIVAFNQASREPDQDLVKGLTESAVNAARNQKALIAFQERMLAVATLPGRARTENRLRSKRGCGFCAAPCRYGYFVLVSDPRFSTLQRMLEAEENRVEHQRNPLRPAWAFAMTHLMRLLDAKIVYITAEHVGNLAFCLLTLSMAKSRYPLPEKQIANFQEANQIMIHG
jgi:hypothetical protein